MHLLAVFTLLAPGVFFLLARQLGRKEAVIDKEEEINRAVLEAALYRDRLDRDPAYARRMRERFTRRLLPDVRAGLFREKRHGGDKTADRPE